MPNVTRSLAIAAVSLGGESSIHADVAESTRAERRTQRRTRMRRDQAMRFLAEFTSPATTAKHWAANLLTNDRLSATNDCVCVCAGTSTVRSLLMPPAAHHSSANAAVGATSITSDVTTAVAYERSASRTGVAARGAAGLIGADNARA